MSRQLRHPVLDTIHVGIDGDRGHHSAPLSSAESSCCRSGASLGASYSVPLCTPTRRSCAVRKRIHPGSVVDVVHYSISLGAARHLVVDTVHSYRTVTYMLLVTSFSVSSNRCDVHFRFRYPGQYKFTHPCLNYVHLHCVDV